MGRDNRTQAVLPLRGKILNTESLALSKILENQEVKDLIEALGTGIGPNFDIRKLRYGRVVLLMDADSDGYHISTLLLTFFFRHMRELIAQGKLYIAQPPLYRIVTSSEVLYAQDDAAKEEILARLGAHRKVEVFRFKGWAKWTPSSSRRRRSIPTRPRPVAGRDRKPDRGRPDVRAAPGKRRLGTLPRHHGRGRLRRRPGRVSESLDSGVEPLFLLAQCVDGQVNHDAGPDEEHHVHHVARRRVRGVEDHASGHEVDGGPQSDQAGETNRTVEQIVSARMS